MSKLTDWEAGQDLIACADKLSDSEKDLRDGGRRKHAALLRDLRLTIGDYFNIHHEKSHGFGLAAHETKKAKKR